MICILVLLIAADWICIMSWTTWFYMWYKDFSGTMEDDICLRLGSFSSVKEATAFKGGHLVDNLCLTECICLLLFFIYNKEPVGIYKAKISL